MRGKGSGIGSSIINLAQLGIRRYRAGGTWRGGGGGGGRSGDGNVEWGW